MAVVATVETAVTARLVAPIQMIFVVLIQVLIAANLVKLVVRGLVVRLLNVVMMERASLLVRGVVSARTAHVSLKIVSVAIAKSAMLTASA